MNRYFPTSMIFLMQLNTGGVIAQTAQEHVHGMSHSVMPFDMTKTTHIFTMTETGDVQRVVVRSPTHADQIVLIQQHLHDEARRFQHGDYSDPVQLHGVTMPGLNELRLGAARVKVVYADLPDGG